MHRRLLSHQSSSLLFHPHYARRVTTTIVALKYKPNTHYSDSDLVNHRGATSSAMIIAVLAIVVAVAALAAPYVLSASSGTSKTSPHQTREFYLLSTEWNMDAVPAGLNHYGFTPTEITVSQ